LENCDITVTVPPSTPKELRAEPNKRPELKPHAEEAAIQPNSWPWVLSFAFVGESLPVKLPDSDGTLRQLRGVSAKEIGVVDSDTIATASISAYVLQQVYSHLPNIAQTAGIVVTNPTTVRVEPTAFRWSTLSRPPKVARSQRRS
jgi:hypothetical protein